MISPWSGEGIAEAMEAASVAAETVALALARPAGPRREQALHRYPAELNRRWARYYRLGNAAAAHVFSRFGYRPLLTRRVMETPVLLSTLARLLTQLTDEPSHDAVDRVLHAVLRAVPAPRR